MDGFTIRPQEAQYIVCPHWAGSMPTSRGFNIGRDVDIYLRVCLDCAGMIARDAGRLSEILLQGRD